MSELPLDQSTRSGFGPSAGPDPPGRGTIQTPRLMAVIAMAAIQN
jgi:hypothetical protein